MTSQILKCALLIVFVTSCYRVPDKIEPKVSFIQQESFVKMLTSAFEPLSIDELREEWGKEYNIGVAFAERYDLYRAVTAFKRAEILLPGKEAARRQEAQYYSLLCYYLGYRYADVIEAFNESDLQYVDPSFKTYHDLLVILYESYFNLKEYDHAEHYYEVLKVRYPETAEKLQVSTAMTTADFKTLKEWTVQKGNEKETESLVTSYERGKKSVPLAQSLNMIPGAGYFYVGQVQSGITSLLLNSLFIGASYAFFNNGYTAAGIITTGFELGWYFGGIYGAGEAAKAYNERIYERIAYDTMQRQELFPVFVLKYGF